MSLQTRISKPIIQGNQFFSLCQFEILTSSVKESLREGVNWGEIVKCFPADASSCIKIANIFFRCVFDV